MLRRLQQPGAVLALLILSAAAGACGDPPPTDTAADDTPVDQVEEAIGAGTCTPSLLDGNAAGACTGPWKYDVNLTAYGPDPSCSSNGQQICTTNWSCSNWSFGAGIASGSSSTTTRVTCTTTCPDTGADDCTYRCTPTTDWETPCNNAKNAKYTALVNALPTAPFNARAWYSYLVKVTSSLYGNEISSTFRHINRKTVETTVTDWTCTLNWDTPVPATRADPSCGCAIWGWPSCTHVVGHETRWSANALMESQLPAHTSATCTTCDTTPFDGSATSAAARFACLNASLALSAPAPVDNAALRALVVARAKLLYETAAGVLIEAQRQTLRALFGETSAWGCEPDQPVTEACLATAPAQLASDLRRCSALTGVTVPAASVTTELATCRTLLEEAVDLVPGVGCNDQLRVAAENIVRDLTTRSFERITAASGTLSGVGAALADIDAWYRRERKLFGSDAAHLEAQLGTVFAAFWHRAYSVVLPPGTPTTDAVAASTLAGFENDSLRVDWQVLAAAYANPAPMTSAPLLELTADALRGSHERLAQTTPLHDLACTYLGCTASDTDSVTQLWMALAGLPDTTRLNAALASPSPLAVAHPELATALAGVRDRHSALRSAWIDAGGTGDVSALATVTPPPAAQSLATLVRRAEAVRAHYLAQGSFAATPADALHTTLEAAKQHDILTLLAQRRQSMGQARDHWYSARLSLVTSLLNLMQNDQQGASIDRQLSRLGVQMAQRAADLAGLRAREAEARATYADFWAAFEALRKSGAIDEDLPVTSDVLPPLEVNALDAAYTPPVGARDIPTLAVRGNDGQPWTAHVKAGDVVRFGVTGQWAPACALTRYSVYGPGGQTAPLDLSNPMTGPEGYTLEWTGASYVVHGYESTHTTTQTSTHSTDTCFNLGLGGFTVPYTQIGWEASSKECYSESNGQSWADSSSSSGGASTNLSAKFAGGLRVPGTPFDTLPAGALLLFITAPGNASIFYDVRVITRQTVVVAQKDADYYLVVNDATGCNSPPPSTSALGIEARASRPFGAVAQQVAAAMAATLAEIDGKAASVLASGTFSASEQTLLRENARLRLAQVYGATIEPPPAVQDLWDTFLAAEMASLDRRAQMRAIERELDLSYRDMRALLDDRAATGARSRLLALAPRWALADLVSDETREAREALIKAVRDYVPPLLLVRYPAAYAAARAALQPQLADLRTIDFAAGDDDVMTRLIAFGTALENALGNADVESSASGPTMVAIAFPRPPGPEAPSDPGPGSGDPCNPLLGCLPPPPPDTPPATGPWGSAYWQNVDVTRATALWQGLTEEHVGFFQVTPEDLYRPSGGNAVLVCSEAAPVVQRMGLFAVMPQEPDGLNGTSLRANVETRDDLAFPSAAGLLTYTPDPALAQLGGVRIYSGEDHEAVTDFNAVADATGRGRSPFTTFRVDAAGIPAAKLAKVTAFVLVFEVETRAVPAHTLPVATCE